MTAKKYLWLFLVDLFLFLLVVWLVDCLAGWIVNWIVGWLVRWFVRWHVRSFVPTCVRSLVGWFARSKLWPVSKFLTRTITEDGLNEPGGKPWTRIRNRIVKSQFEESASTILKTMTNKIIPSWVLTMKSLCGSGRQWGITQLWLSLQGLYLGKHLRRKIPLHKKKLHDYCQ